MQSNQDLTILARTDPLQARIWSEMPTWAWISYGLAVGTGLAGAIALLFRLKAAIWLSAICVIAVIAQFSYTFLLTDLLAQKGLSTALFPLFILAMAVIQLTYARSLGTKGALR
ncbi:sugar transporter [Sphingobium nicotianae]|nr:sugar transporter [Sphingobium nicotianae]